MVKIAGSFLKIQDDEKKIRELDKVCDVIHVDVMDGKFTERPTIPLVKMKEILRGIKNKFDVHLMVLNLKKYIDEVALFNPNFITFHIESTLNVQEIIDYIHSKGIKAGIAINPDTNIEKIYPYLDSVEMVLVMSVKAGAGGQHFIDITDRLHELIDYRKKNDLNYLLEVDGGIDDTTIKLVQDADIIVTGSFITDSENYQSQIYKLKKALRNGFTLAELLGVIVVLSILGLVAITAIDNNIKKSRYDSCLVQQTSLIEGAKMVMLDHPNLLPAVGSSVTISAEQLQDGATINGEVIDAGYIEDDMINPMTDKPYVDSTGGVSVEITTTNGSSFDYTVVYGNDDESCHR